MLMPVYSSPVPHQLLRECSGKNTNEYADFPERKVYIYIDECAFKPRHRDLKNPKARDMKGESPRLSQWDSTLRSRFECPDFPFVEQ